MAVLLQPATCKHQNQTKRNAVPVWFPAIPLFLYAVLCCSTFRFIHVVEVITQVIIVIMRSDAMQVRITLFRYNWKILIDTDCNSETMMKTANERRWWRWCKGAYKFVKVHNHRTQMQIKQAAMMMSVCRSVADELWKVYNSLSMN